MNEFINDNTNIYVNIPYVEAYIPMELFGDPEKEATTASQYGNGIRTIGLFNIRFFTSDTQDREKVKLNTFNYPNIIDTYPTEYEQNVTLTINGITDKFMLLKYYKGDVMMQSYTPQSSDNGERFLNMLMKGKIPSTISYNDVYQIWLKNLNSNSINPGVPSVTMQIIISELYRNKNNPIEQFRKVAGKGKVNLYDYLTFNMNEVAAYTSVLSALTFERFSDKLVTSLIMTKTGVQQNKSPLEKVLSM